MQRSIQETRALIRSAIIDISIYLIIPPLQVPEVVTGIYLSLVLLIVDIIVLIILVPSVLLPSIYVSTRFSQQIFRR